MPSYVLVAELALCRVLTGTLPRPTFPERLRQNALRRWRWEGNFAPHHAATHARLEDVAACLGKLSFALLAEAHARLSVRGEWVCNEKGLTKRGGLAETERLVLEFPGRSGHLTAAVDAVRAAISDERSPEVAG